MAQRVETIFEDDLDGGKADDTVTFAVDGSEYEIDLSHKNADEFYKVISRYVDAARNVKSNGARKHSTVRKPKSNGHSPVARTPEFRSLVREWARANPEAAGAKVGDRGRIPESVYAAYESK